MAKDIYYEGFLYKGFKFGWRKKTLWRLPVIKDKRTYALKKVPKIKDITYGTAAKPIEGYHIMRDKKSLSQVRGLTRNVMFFVDKNDCEECA